MVGLTGSSGALVATARAQTGSAVDRAAIDVAGFEFGKVSDIHAPDFLPGGAKYGDLSGILSLSAPDELWLAGHDRANADLIQSAYKAVGVAGALTTFTGVAKKTASSAVKWLLK